MTNTEIGNSVSVTSAQDLDYRFESAKEIAHDLLQGVHQDYLFFYNGSGQIDVTTYYQQYVLLIGDFTSYSNLGTFAMENVQVFQIYSIRESFHPFTNFSFNGTEIDLDSSPVSSFSGSGTSSHTDYRYRSQYFTYHRDNVSVTASSGIVLYSSLDNFPHLIEGVQNYAFAAFCLAFAVVIFKLGDRLFRRVY